MKMGNSRVVVTKMSVLHVNYTRQTSRKAISQAEKISRNREDSRHGSNDEKGHETDVEELDTENDSVSIVLK